MKVIKVFIQAPVITIELNKSAIELESIDDIKQLETILSKSTLNQLEKSILSALKNNLDTFTLNF